MSKSVEALYFRIKITLLSIILVLAGVWLILLAQTKSEVQWARFRVEALGRYLAAYHKITGKEIMALQGLPDFVLSTTDEKYMLHASDFKKNLIDGYFYDYEYLGEGRFVLSASPLRVFPSCPEFGFTDKGTLRTNTVDVDHLSDSYNEVEGWQEIPGRLLIHTKH